MARESQIIMQKTFKRYGVDKDGFILTKAHPSKIKKPFSKIVTEVKAHLLAKSPDQIHSIYVYGSVATGKAKLKTSDLDILVVFKRKQDPKPVENFSKTLSKNYKSFVREVGIAVSDTKEIAADKYGWGCFIKHLCVDIYGENLSKKLPKFKPSQKVALAFNGDCQKVIADALKKLSADLSKEEILKLCRSTMRKIVRTGFSQVMDREKSWTTDLKKSYLAFIKYHPDQKALMRQALDLALAPTSNKHQLLELLSNFANAVTIGSSRW